MPFFIFKSGSFAVPIRDNFRSGIICAPTWGSFAVRDHLRLWDHLRTLYISSEFSKQIKLIHRRVSQLIRTKLKQIMTTYYPRGCLCLPQKYFKTENIDCFELEVTAAKDVGRFNY